MPVKPRLLAAGLMLLSGITHPAQLWLFDLDPAAASAAKGGAIFFLVGLGLLTRFRVALYVGIGLPLLGATTAVARMLEGAPTTALTPVHVLIDLVVIGLCIGALRGTAAGASETTYP